MKNLLNLVLRTGFVVLARLSKRFSRIRLYDWLDVELKRLAPGARVLCIGAGGKLDEMIRAGAASDVVVIDIDPIRQPDIIMDATRLAFEDGSFDAVFMMEVLEHVKEPFVAISEVQRVLKEGGAFVLSTPFTFGIHEAPYDFYRFTRYGLLHMLSNFSGVTVRERNGYYASIVVLFMRSIFSPGRHRMLIGGVLIILGLPFFLMLHLLDRVVRDEGSTTGYFVTAFKP